MTIFSLKKEQFMLEVIPYIFKIFWRDASGLGGMRRHKEGRRRRRDRPPLPPRTTNGHQ